MVCVVIVCVFVLMRQEFSLVSSHSILKYHEAPNCFSMLIRQLLGSLTNELDMLMQFYKC